MQHLLVVEDEGLAAMALEDLLLDEGYRVTLVGDGETALAAFREQPVDAVITDLKMPKMNGAELMCRLREIDAMLPIIVLTGYRALTPDVEAVVDRLPGRTPVFEKPVSLDMVSATLRDLLRAA